MISVNNATKDYLVDVYKLTPSAYDKIISNTGYLTSNSIESFISSSTIPGVYTPSISNVIDRFLSNAKTSWDTNKANSMIFLYQLGLKATRAENIYKKFKNKTQKTIELDPYAIQEVDGIGFKIADNIVLNHLNYTPTSICRINGGIRELLKQDTVMGHSYRDNKDILNALEKLLWDENGLLITSQEKEELIKNLPIALEQLHQQHKIVIDNGFIYQPDIYYAEENSAKLLANFISQNKNFESPNINVKKILSDTKVSYNSDQLKAINMAVNNKISIITGGPGTGKSTTIAGLTYVLESDFESVAVLAPTGKAANRDKEVLNNLSCYITKTNTIHKALEASSNDKFSKNEKNQLQYSTIIIDEASMIPIKLLEALMKAINPNTRLVFVLDNQQLGPVEPGSPIIDLSKSPLIPNTQLTINYRQQRGLALDDMIQNIREGKTKNVLYASYGDDSIQVYDVNMPYRPSPEEKKYFAEETESILLDIAKDYYQSGKNLNDFQVLCVSNRGLLGTEKLNKQLQSIFNPQYKKAIMFANKMFKEGDRVIQLKNNYYLSKDGLMNGEIGIIKKIEDNYLKIQFDNKLIDYPKKNLYQLDLAYALTVHKMQGSEVKNSLFVYSLQDYHLTYKETLVTATSRSKDSFIFVGSKKLFESSLNKHLERKSQLISKTDNFLKEVKTLNPILNLSSQKDDINQLEFEFEF